MTNSYAMNMRPYKPGSISQAHRDVTDNRYRELRRPRRVRFFCNGDRYFRGRQMNITPHRYMAFSDLLGDLTGKMPGNVHLPYGVRNIYTPVGGRRVRELDDLVDGQNYVCAGFENFRPLQYGNELLERWTTGKPHHHDYRDFNNDFRYGGGKAHAGAFQPGRLLRNSYPYRKQNGTFGNREPGGPHGHWGTAQSQEPTATQMKPKVITVIRNGPSPRPDIKILLNRRSVQSYEQLIKDISEAFGPKWKNSKARKLYTLKGREVNGVSDFFREDDVFIAVGHDQITQRDVQEILEDLYPESPYSKSLLKEWEKSRKKRLAPGGPVGKRGNEGFDDDIKRDSGLGSDASNRDDADRDEVIYKGRHPDQSRANKKKDKHGHGADDEMGVRLDRERQKAADDERERARKRMNKRMEAERRALDEERRKRGLVPLKPINDPFKKMQEEREKDRRRKMMEEKMRREEEEPDRRSRMSKESGDRVIVVVKEDPNLSHRASKSPHRSPSVKPHAEESRPRSNAKSDSLDPENDELSSRRSISPAKSPSKSPVRSPVKSPIKSPAKSPVKEAPTPIIEEETAPEKDEGLEEEATLTDLNADNKDNEADDDTNANLEEVPEEPELSEPVRPKTPHKEEIIKPEDLKESADKDQKKKKKEKGPIIVKTKIERQISNLDHVMSKYEPGKMLGDGNFAVVKQCKLKNTNTDYAMKVIDKAKLKGKEMMIENEIAIMKVCNHANIVKLIEEFETKDEIYLIMELVKGGDLFDAITQSVKFGERESSCMISDLVSALFYLHSRTIVHRDLKPENLLVCRNKDGTVTLKLADFGLAMEVKEPIYTVCGTPTYVAPEILSEIGYGLEVDMWAVGVITYILLCGFPPFRSPDRNQTELFEFIKAGEYEFLSPYWDNISRGAKDLIANLLVVDKKRRFKAEDVLCHPWIITQGGALKAPINLEEYRKNLRRDLQTQGKENLADYQKKKLI